MKKLSLKSKFLLGAILMGGMVAGAQTISHMSNEDDPKYDWTSTAIAPNHPSSQLPEETEAQAKLHFGCGGEGAVCATGELVSGDGDPTATIRLN